MHQIPSQPRACASGQFQVNVDTIALIRSRSRCPLVLDEFCVSYGSAGAVVMADTAELPFDAYDLRPMTRWRRLLSRRQPSKFVLQPSDTGELNLT